MDQQELSRRQFGAQADAYLTSSVHAAGADLERLQSLVRDLGAVRALDLGCGAGHATFALARGGARVTAYDPSPEMLAVVSRESAARGHEVCTEMGPAERLPFAGASFDLVVTRFSAHHWANVPQALGECARVMTPCARLVVIDVICPEDRLLDTPLQVIEYLRDGSHVRNYRESEWSSMLTGAGFSAPSTTLWKLALEFKSWVARIGTPPARIAALNTVFSSLSGEMRDYLHIAPDGSFCIEAAWMETHV